MSVPQYKRSESKLVAIIKARELATYTIQICSNEKHFMAEYKTALTDDIVRTAKSIYMRSWRANNIKVNGGVKASERTELQRQAILDCNELLALIELALKVYHLRAGRVEHWVRLTVECKALLEGWHKQTKEKYADLLK